MTDMTLDGSIADTFLRTYGIRIAALVRRKTVLGVVGEDGQRFMFKPLSERDDEMRLTALAALHPIFRQANLVAALPLRTLSGNYVASMEHVGMGVGYLQPWLTGRHVDLAKTDERICAVQAVARMQRASIYLGRPSSDIFHHGSLLAKLRVKQRAIARIWSVVERAYPMLAERKTELMDRMSAVIHRYVTYTVHHRRASAQSLAFCHRDLAPHNMLWQGDGSVGFIDFDHASYDDMLHDAMQLLSHSVYVHRMSQDEFDDLLMAYADDAGLPPSKLYLLQDLALWPDIVIRTMLELYRVGCPEHGKLRLSYALRQDGHKRELVEGSAIAEKRLSEY